MSDKRLTLIFLIIFIDIVGFGFIMPLLPYYAKAFGANATVIGLLLASYSFVQFFAVPVLGRLSDRYGRKPVLLISTIGDCIGFLLLGLAGSIYILFLGRIISGLTGSNISVAQAYISDVTEESARAKGFGLIGAAFGLGFIVGPALGGILSIFGFAVPALTAALVSFLNLIAIYLYLPESLSKKSRACFEKKTGVIQTIRKIRQSTKLSALFAVDISFGYAFIIFQSTFALYAQYRFNLSSQYIGYIFAYIGFLIVLMQGYIVGKLASRFSDIKLIFSAVIIMTFSLLGWAYANSLIVLLLILIPLSLSGGIYDIIITSMLSKSVNKRNVGEILGFSASMEILTRAIAPTFGGIILQYLGTSAPGIFGTVITIGLAFFIVKYRSYLSFKT